MSPPQWPLNAGPNWHSFTVHWLVITSSRQPQEKPSQSRFPRICAWHDRNGGRAPTVGGHWMGESSLCVYVFCCSSSAFINHSPLKGQVRLKPNVLDDWLVEWKGKLALNFPSPLLLRTFPVRRKTYPVNKIHSLLAHRHRSKTRPTKYSVHPLNIMSWKKGRVESRGAIFQRVPRREGIRIPIPAGPSKWNGSPLLELLSCAHLLVQHLHFSHSPLILFGGNPESGKQI